MSALMLDFTDTHLSLHADSVVLLFPSATLCTCLLGLLLLADGVHHVALPCASYLLLMKSDTDAAGTDTSSRATGGHSPVHQNGRRPFCGLHSPLGVL